MIKKELLKDYAKKLMFDMEEEEYKTLEKEFEILLKQMDIISSIEEIKGVEPMIFPFELSDVVLRDDNFNRNISVEEALSNTDSKKGKEIKVPKVVE